MEIRPPQDASARRIDDVALLVHHLVELQDAHPDVLVLLFDPQLGVANGAGDDAGLDRLVRRLPEPVHQLRQIHVAEPVHQFVAEGQVEPGLADVALPARPAAQLVVDAARLVAFGADHVQPAQGDHLLGLGRHGGLDLREFLAPGPLVVLRGVDRVQVTLTEPLVDDEVHVAAEHDVGAATGHFGGDGDRTEPAGLRDDGRLLLVVLGVEDGVRNVQFRQFAGQVFGLLDARGPDQHRLALAVAFGDVADHRLELGQLGFVHGVGLVPPNVGFVGGNGDDTESVDVAELGGLGLGRAGHAGELVVEPEVVLQRDGGQRLVLGLDLHALFGLDGLVQPLVVAAPEQDPAGEVVHDQHLTVGDDVVLVAGEQLLGLQRVAQVADQWRVAQSVEIVDSELVLDERDALLMDADGTFAEIHLVVGVRPHQIDYPGELVVPRRGVVGGPGDDQWGTGLVDEDRVDLVDDGVAVPALNRLLEGVHHVVA